MSRLAISQYYRDLDQIIQYGGSRNEASIRFAFQSLLNEHCQAKDFLLVPELPYKDKKIIPDGTVKDTLRLDWGYWEAKDEDDYERPEVKDFRQAIAIFNEDLPTILIRLREMINGQSANNVSFITARDKFLKIFQQSINPEVDGDDVREMIIQHILTEDIFTNIFNEWL